MNDAYLEGFMAKCAERGIDPEELLKRAQATNDVAGARRPVQLPLPTRLPPPKRPPFLRRPSLVDGSKVPGAPQPQPARIAGPVGAGAAKTNTVAVKK